MLRPAQHPTPPRDTDPPAGQTVSDLWLDAALEDSFPASDPIAWPRDGAYAGGDGR